MIKPKVSIEMSLAVPCIAQLALAANKLVFAFVFLVSAFVLAPILVIFAKIWALLAEVIVIFVVSLDVILKVLSGCKHFRTN